AGPVREEPAPEPPGGLRAARPLLHPRPRGRRGPGPRRRRLLLRPVRPEVAARHEGAPPGALLLLHAGLAPRLGPARAGADGAPPQLPGVVLVRRGDRGAAATPAAGPARVAHDHPRR